ncbi:MAG: uracil-DNA glycosylase [Gammaproteobacteria bacterium]|nr:MAG: uracil-DNA glycosylase [Gammaproteobacteria bacterium]RKZ43350.1 MAG: uracil-DNA glycosylase [Gammaproteobacteria bacterium]RKZ73420.1 MAG: uracil-DNA glycosylase [Gammaproteobacteria bacterium]
MLNSLHAQYLKAMGIQVWVRRQLPTALREESSPVNIAVTTQPEPIPAIIEKPTQVNTNEIPEIPGNNAVPKIRKESPLAEPPVPLPKQNHQSVTAVQAPSEDSPELDWETLQSRVAACTVCELHLKRTQTVFGVGNRQADLMLIGEAPGADEDAKGEPFVGQAGQLLNAMLYAIDLKRESVYITNVVKCRPPDNRNPHPYEITCCNDFLKHQIALVKPKLLVAVGRVAAHHLLSTDIAISKLRSQRYEYGKTKIPLIVTYHPAYLLRRPTEKRHSWQDLQFIRQTINP